MKKYMYLIVIFLIGLVSCTPAYSSPTLMEDQEVVTIAPVTQSTPATLPLTASYSIEALMDRDYGDGELTVEYVWEQKEEFTRYYITYTEGGVRYRLWIEDETSMAARLRLIDRYNLAGVAAWRRGFEVPIIWQLIERELGTGG